MKKEYLKPEAEYIDFYTKEEITVDAELSGGLGEGGDWGEGDE